MLLQSERSQLLLVDVQERLLPAMAEPGLVTENGAILIRAAKELSVPILASEQYPKGLGHTVPELSNLLPANAIYEKLEFSCFANRGLRSLLQGPDRQTVIFGIESHVCVLQTALDMRASDLDVTVVIDATSSRRAESKQTALLRLQTSGVRVATTEMVVFEWLRRAGTPQFKVLSALIR